MSTWAGERRSGEAVRLTQLTTHDHKGRGLFVCWGEGCYFYENGLPPTLCHTHTQVVDFRREECIHLMGFRGGYGQWAQEVWEVWKEEEMMVY